MQTRLTCEIPALGSAGTLNVYEFAGEEALSQLFSFDVIAASYDEYIPLKDLIRQKVKLSLEVTPGEGYHDRTVHGLVTSVTDWGEGYGNKNYYFYRMAVRPRLWLLGLKKRSRVFRQMSVPEIVEQVLKDHGLAGSDFEFQLEGEYPLRDQTVQHEETDLAFIRRLLEYEGIFFFFISKGDGDVIVFRDVNPEKSGDLDVGDVQLVPQVHLDTERVHVNQFRGQCRVATADVAVWDHDYENFPSGNLSEQVKGDAGAPDQHGIYEEYDERVKEPHTPATWSGDAPSVENENKDKRKSRLEQLAQRRREEVQANHGEFYTGSSNQVDFANGSVFSLVGWEGEGPKAPDRYMKTYLVTRVRHAGSGHHQFEMGAVNQLPRKPFGGSYDELFRLLDAEEGTPDEEASGYANGITCIELATPYRPPRETPWPRIHGVVTGKVEKYPGDKLLDEEGRYKVRMPFDPEGGGTSKGEPSRPVRMAQPYSGQDYGMHFPNQEDAEAVVAFIDGNIDRPIMLSTVSNPKNHTPAPLKTNTVSTTEETNIIRTVTDNQVILEDQKDKQGVRIYTPNANSVIQMGASVIQDAPPPLTTGISLSTDETCELYGDQGVVINAGGGFVPDVQKFKQNIANVDLVLDAVAAAVGKTLGLESVKGVVDDLAKAFTSWAQGIKSPGVFISGQAGIGMSSPNKLSAYTAQGINLFTASGVDIGAKEDGIRIATDKGGTNVFVRKGGIGLRTYEGDVLGRTETGGVKLVAGNVPDPEAVEKRDIKSEAEKNAHVIAKKEDIYVTAEKQNIFITAGKEKNSEAQSAKQSVAVDAKKEVTIKAGEKILLECGQSSIELRENGTILIKGKNINVEAQQKIEANGKQHVGVTSKKNVDVEGKMGVNIEGMKVNSKAKVMNKTEGKMVNSKASAASILKGGIVKIN